VPRSHKPRLPGSVRVRGPPPAFTFLRPGACPTPHRMQARFLLDSNPGARVTPVRVVDGRVTVPQSTRVNDRGCLRADRIQGTVVSLRPVVQAGRLGASRCLPCDSSAALGDEARHGGADSQRNRPDERVAPTNASRRRIFWGILVAAHAPKCCHPFATRGCCGGARRECEHLPHTTLHAELIPSSRIRKPVQTLPAVRSSHRQDPRTRLRGAHKGSINLDLPRTPESRPGWPPPVRRANRPSPPRPRSSARGCPSNCPMLGVPEKRWPARSSSWAGPPAFVRLASSQAMLWPTTGWKHLSSSWRSY
jgi:hypothetical protein